MVVREDKQKDLWERFAKLGVDRKKDLQESVALGSGKGGQKKNKTSSAVHIKHLPSGIEASCQNNRSQELNRFLAYRKLCERLEKELLGIKSPQEKKAEKIRKQKKRRKRRSTPSDETPTS